MARCDCAGSRCTCSIVAGDGVSLTGSGDAANPYIIGATPQGIAGLVQVQDTATLDLHLAGSGLPNEPYIISGDVTVSTDQITGLVEVTDTASLDLTLAGTGTTADPYSISGEVLGSPATSVAGLIEVNDTATLDLQLTGSGTTADPYMVAGNVIAGAATEITGLVQVSDTDSLDLTLTGAGTTGDPYVLSGDATAVVEPPTQNLVSNPGLRDGGVAAGAGGSIGLANAVSPDVPGFYYRRGTVIVLGAGTFDFWLNGFASEGGITAVEPNQAYSISLSAFENESVSGIAIEAIWYDGTGNQLSITTAPLGGLATGVWERRNATINSPASAAFVHMTLNWTGVTNAGSKTLGVGGVLFEESPATVPYVPPVPLRLENLYDVRTPAPASGQVLGWDGGAWVAMTTTEAALADSTDNTQRSQLLVSALTTWDPPQIAVGAQESVDLTVAGVELSESWVFDVTSDISRQGLIVQASVTAADTVTIVAANLTGAPVDLGSGTWRVYGWR